MPFDQVHNPHLPQRILIDIILEESSYASTKPEKKKKKQFNTALFINISENRMDLE